MAKKLLKKENYEDVPSKFWNDWLDSDEDERIKLIQKTMIARESAEYLLLRLNQNKVKNKSKIDEKFIREITARNINYFLQDFEQVIQARTKKSTKPIKNHNI